MDEEFDGENCTDPQKWNDFVNACSVLEVP